MTDLDFTVDGGETAYPTDGLRAHLKAVISGSSVLGGNTPGNDVPFFLCPYVPEEEAAMLALIDGLIGDFKADDLSVLKIDIYDVLIGVLKRKRWDKILALEARESKKKYLSTLQSALHEAEVLVPEIQSLAQSQPHDLVFLTGFARAFPVIRSYRLLSNLQSVLKDVPTVIFFPGRYSQSSDAGFTLKTLGRMKEQNYYRAHNILHMRAVV